MVDDNTEMSTGGRFFYEAACQAANLAALKGQPRADCR